MAILAKQLKQLSEELGISHSEIARRLGLSERRYSHYVTGEREPRLGTLALMARKLATSPNELLGWPGEEGQLTPLQRRLQSAAAELPDGELEAFIIQIEAIAQQRRKRRKKPK